KMSGSYHATNTWRMFCAIEIPAAIRQRITKHIDQIKRQDPEAKAAWTREENIHLTLKFLGNIPVTRTESLCNAAATAASHINPFQLAIDGCGAFPPRGTPRVLWIGIEDPSGSLSRLFQNLEDECANAGFEREERSFSPHLTIARIKHPQ